MTARSSMKLGIYENSVDDFEIAELRRSNTSKSEDEKLNLKYEGRAQRHF